MCLALPVRVIELREGERAVVDAGGVRKEISVSLVEGLEPGDYVILHVGYALTRLDAAEAERSGLVARVFPADQLLDETLKAAATIAGFSLPVVMMVKESVNRAYESSLNEGLLFERRTFHACFALEDQEEGMAAFVEKRKPAFKNR